MSNRLQDKVALVTGGTNGIGKAAVEGMTREGSYSCMFHIMFHMWLGSHTSPVPVESSGDWPRARDVSRLLKNIYYVRYAVRRAEADRT